MPRRPTSSEPAEPPAAALRLVLSPQGRLHLEAEPDGQTSVPPRIATELERAFRSGSGPGLLHLGAAPMPTHLPPSLAYWREFAHLFVARFCAANGTDAKPQPPAPPRRELEDLVRAAPELVGGEYLTASVLETLWVEVHAALREASEQHGGAQQFLAGLNPAWHLVGRVCFHLAENKRNVAKPFAFLATYAAAIGRGDKVQHKPLGEALREFADDREQLLALLAPMQRASKRSPLIAELVASKAVFHAQAWDPDQAFRFLQDVVLLEESGVVTRIPDWWHPDRRKRSRVAATVTIGAPTDGQLGLDSLLSFEVRLALDGEKLTAEERRQLEQATSGLVLIKGRWVEVDRQKLQQALQHWQRFGRQMRDGLGFAEGMRLLAGVTLGDEAASTSEEIEQSWTEFVADRQLDELLSKIRDPAAAESAHPGPALRATLRPYQELGLRWLWLLYRLGLGACLADDMGLGKTAQVVALLLRIQKESKGRGQSLVVVPASLIANWSAELARFAPSLKVLVAHPSAMPSAKIEKLTARRLAGIDVVITSYGTLLRQKWPASVQWQAVVLDEAQAIKNPNAKQTRAVKALRSRGRVVLTGTPIENRLSDLWSLFDFACPGLLGTSSRFARYVKGLGSMGHGPLRDLVRPYILRRLKSDRRVIADLPDKVETLSHCMLSKKQAVLYQQSVEALRRQLDEVDEGVERRGLVLAFLMRLKQICNHPSQWLDDGDYRPQESGKFQRLAELCDEIAARQEKVLVFTQFRQVIDPIASFLGTVFGREGLVLHGGTAVKQRQKLVEAFGRADGPPFFVLSLKAGGTGLNLTAASHVIHFDRWWNPAVENQATDRAYRIGQHRNVLVHKFVCRGTVEERIDELIAAKVALSDEILGGGDELPLTELSNEDLMQLVSLDIDAAIAE
ncbi:MAG: DEAD/DEAH box helicase [Planctomycetes bacterium]|nr:DEAD/DEAH box helicase [Planctomycetota bacterium]